jgi:hypothetical protein
MLPSHFMEKTTGDPLGRLFGHNRRGTGLRRGKWAKRCPAQKPHPAFGCRFRLSLFDSAPEQQ